MGSVVFDSGMKTLPQDVLLIELQVILQFRELTTARTRILDDVLKTSCIPGCLECIAEQGPFDSLSVKLSNVKMSVY